MRIDVEGRTIRLSHINRGSLSFDEVQALEKKLRGRATPQDDKLLRKTVERERGRYQEVLP